MSIPETVSTTKKAILCPFYAWRVGRLELALQLKKIPIDFSRVLDRL
jgi:hypothetical protein